MRVRLLLAIATLDCAVSFAQLPDSVWSRAYGGEWHQRAVRIAATPDGGIAIAGNDEHGGDFSDFFLMRFAANGDSLWARTYGADSIDVLTDFLVTTAGEFVLAGYSLQLFDGFYHVDVIKASVDGNVVWEYPQFPVDLDHDEFCFGISSHPSGGYVGTWDVTLGSLRRAGLFGLTDEGQSNWSSSTTWNSDQRFHDLTVRWNGSEYAAGFVANGPAGGDDALLVYHHIDHTEWWSRRYGGPSRDRCLKIIETSDGGYLLGGTTLSFGAGDQDIWLLKINAQGDSLWSQTFGGAYFDDFGGVIETANGGFLIVGTHEDAADGNFNLLLGWCNATGGD